MKWTCWATVGCLLAWGGCATKPPPGAPLGQAGKVVGPCIEAMGGLKRWSRVGPIHATAVVTLYDDAGRAMINEHRHVFDLPAGTLTASADLPAGRWTATVSQHAPTRFQSGAAMSGEARSRLVKALETTLHRVQGPLNFCGDGAEAEQPGAPERVRLASMDLVRVPVRSGRTGVVAYYFDARTYLLRLATAGGDAPGEEGTVTLYTYRMSPNGMAFPARLAVMKIGRHVLVGDKPVLEVDYHRVRFPPDP